MAIEYKEYNSPYNQAVKKPVNNDQVEPVKNVTDSDIISDALKIMSDAQLNNKEPVNNEVVNIEPVQEPDYNNVDNNINTIIDPNIILEPEVKTDIIQEPVNNEVVNIEPVKEPEPEPVFLNFKHSSTFFKRMFNLIGVIANETKINFNKNNINLNVVDQAHVEMLTVDIPSNAIEEYNINTEVSIGFDIEKINHVLKSSTNKDFFNFRYNHELYKANIQIGFFNHEINLLNTDGLPDSKIPTLNLPSRIVINTDILYNFLVQAGKISDHIKITITRHGLRLYTESDSNKLEVFLTLDNIEFLYCYNNSGYTSLFSTDYLLNTVKALKPIFNKLELNIGNDNPLRIIGDNGYKVTVILAPRIESE